MNKKYTYYCVYRPAGPGTIPRGVTGITDLDPNEYIPEIGNGAYSIVTYDRPLTEKELYDFELVPCGTAKEADSDVEQTVG